LTSPIVWCVVAEAEMAEQNDDSAASDANDDDNDTQAERWSRLMKRCKYDSMALLFYCHHRHLIWCHFICTLLDVVHCPVRSVHM